MGLMWWRLLLLGLLTYGWFCVCVDFLALLFVVGIAVAFMLCCARGFAWYACGVRACRFTMFWCNFVAGF